MDQSRDDEYPELIFEGDYAEAVFLKSLLESSAMEVSLRTFLKGGGPPRLYVKRRDAADALSLVADFERRRRPPE